jgi:tRNA pseudouridine55 synthase
MLRYAYPEFTLEILCGSGTYVRSLGRDIAQALGTGAVMSELQRTAIGPFQVAHALEVESLSRERLAANLLSPLLGLTDLPHIVVDDRERQRLAQGLSIRDRWDTDDVEIVALDNRGRLSSIVVHRRPGELRSRRNFPVTD